MLETATYEKIYVNKAIPTAYLRLSDSRRYPGDHWTTVLEKDSRMKWSNYCITYPEKRNLMERILTEGEPLLVVIGKGPRMAKVASSMDQGK